MGTHIKTTIEISDALLEQAKRLARSRRSTLRALVEEGLRRVLEHEPDAGFRLEDASVGGEGVRADIREGDWARLAELTYEGRGA